MYRFVFGGILIGLGAVLLLLFTGYLSGMNSMLDTIFIYNDDFQYRWKTIWLSTFVVLGIIVSMLQNYKVESLPLNIKTFISFYILAVGVRMAQGCTSGHGINGLARLSKRSLIAVIFFFSFAVLTATKFKLLTIKNTTSIYKKSIFIPFILVMLWIIYAFKKTKTKDEDKQINLKNSAAILFSASLFAGGIIYSGMYKFSTVNQFINLNHSKWNIGLLIVFISAVVIATIGIQLILKYKKQPVITTCEQTYIKNDECKFILPKRNKITTKLIIGSILFGIGWGLTGMCPSTFPIRLGLGDPSSYLALIALFLGYKTQFNLSQIRSIKKSNDVLLHQFFDPPSSSFTYIVGDSNTNEVVIIDSVYNKTNYNIPTNRIIGNLYYCNPNIPTSQALIKFCNLMNYNIKYLINTHIHVDHITSNNEIKKIKYIPSIIGSYPNTSSDFTFETMNDIKISNKYKLDIIKTPGHTKYCHSLLLKNNKQNILFTGDVLLITGVGRSDLDSTQNSSEIRNNKTILFDSLLNIITEIEPLKNQTIIYPAHDYTEKQSILYENIFTINPYMKFAQNYFNTKDITIKEKFIYYFTEKEQSLAQFDKYDIDLCVDINKICGIVDDVQDDILDKLWSKSSGACG